MGENFIQNKFIKKNGNSFYHMNNFMHFDCRPYGMVIGDFNGDGRDDIICFIRYNYDDRSVSNFRLLLSDGYKYYEVNKHPTVASNFTFFPTHNDFYHISGNFVNDYLNRQELGLIFQTETNKSFFTVEFNFDKNEREFSVNIRNKEVSFSNDDCNLSWFRAGEQHRLEQLYIKSFITGDFNGDKFTDILCRSSEIPSTLGANSANFIRTGIYSSLGNNVSYVHVNISGMENIYSAHYHWPNRIDNGDGRVQLLQMAKTISAKINEDKFQDIVSFSLGRIDDNSFNSGVYLYINNGGDGLSFTHAGQIWGVDHAQGNIVDYVFDNFDGVGADDILFHNGDRYIGYRLYSNKEYISGDETEPDKTVAVSTSQICHAQHIISLDINGDGKKDFFCYYDHFAENDNPSDHQAFVHISDIGQPVSTTQNQYDIEIYYYNFTQRAGIILDRENINVLTKQSAYAFNNVSQVQNFLDALKAVDVSPDTATRGLSGQKTGFSLKISASEKYSTKTTITNLETFTDHNSQSFKIGLGFEVKTKIIPAAAGGAGAGAGGAAGADIEMALLDPFAVLDDRKFSSKGLGAPEFTFKANFEYTKIEGWSHTYGQNKAIEHAQEDAYTTNFDVNVVLAPFECAYAKSSFVKYSAVDIPFSADAIVLIKDRVTDQYINDINLVKVLFDKYYKLSNGHTFIENNQLKFTLEGKVETSIFSDALAKIQECDINALNISGFLLDAEDFLN